MGFKGGTRAAPIMPRYFSLSDSKCLNGGQKCVKELRVRVEVVRVYLVMVVMRWELRYPLMLGIFVDWKSPAFT